jgi:hypothetical protein
MDDCVIKFIFLTLNTPFAIDIFSIPLGVSAKPYSET